MYVKGCSHVWERHVLLCVEAQADVDCLPPSFHRSPFYLPRQGLSGVSGLSLLSGICCVHLPYMPPHPPGVYVHSKISNSSPHAYMAKVLSTEPLLWSLCPHFEAQKCSGLRASSWSGCTLQRCLLLSQAGAQLEEPINGAQNQERNGPKEQVLRVLGRIQAVP